MGGWILAGWAAAAPASAEPQEIRQAYLAIGQGWAHVREVRRADLRPGKTEFVLDGIPAEADLSSLVIRSGYAPVEMAEWIRGGMPGRQSGQTGALAGVVWKDGNLVLNPRSSGVELPAQDGVGPSDGQVRCRLDMKDFSGPLVFEVSCLLTGLSWSARYQVAIRGDRADELEPVSVDLAGFVTLRNGTGKSFSNAAVRLAGSFLPPAANTREGLGFYYLDPDNPLDQLLVPVPPLAPGEHGYAVRGRISIPPRDAVDVVVVQTSRKPAERMYSLKSEDVPLDSGKQGYPLRKFIVFANDATHGLGLDLPAGPVEVSLGGLRNRLLQNAWLFHTPAGGEIRIDLGQAGEVKGWRRSAGVTEAIAGYFEAAYSIEVLNGSPVNLKVEVDEKPPVNFEWAVIRASHPCDIQAQRLKFAVEVLSHSRQAIEYRIRVRQPGIPGLADGRL